MGDPNQETTAIASGMLNRAVALGNGSVGLAKGGNVPPLPVTLGTNTALAFGSGHTATATGQNKFAAAFDKNTFAHNP